MKIIDKLNYEDLAAALKSELHVSAHIIVESRLELDYVMCKLKENLYDDNRILFHRHSTTFRNAVVGSMLSISVVYNEEDVSQNICGRVLDQVYMRVVNGRKCYGILKSRIRRPSTLPCIDEIIGVFLFKDL